LNASLYVTDLTQMCYKNWLRDFTTELTGANKKTLEMLAGYQSSEHSVFIASLPNGTLADQVKEIRTTAQAGLIPVPHLAARKILDGHDLAEHLRNYNEAGNVEHILLIGGDRPVPAGKFESASQIMQTDAFKRAGLKRISFGCYPEGHPKISHHTLMESLKEKIALASALGLETQLITQLCFDPAAIVNFTKDLRNNGITVPLRVGVSSVTTHASLLKYALICGVGSSLKTLSAMGENSKILVSEKSPKNIIRGVAASVALEPELNISGLHFYGFGAFTKTLKWIDDQLSHDEL